MYFNNKSNFSQLRLFVLFRFLRVFMSLEWRVLLNNPVRGHSGIMNHPVTTHEIMNKIKGFGNRLFMPLILFSISCIGYNCWYVTCCQMYIPGCRVSVMFYVCYQYFCLFINNRQWELWLRRFISYIFNHKNTSKNNLRHCLNFSHSFTIFSSYQWESILQFHFCFIE